MRVLLTVSLIVLMGTLPFGCGPSRQEVLDSSMNSWVGHHRDDLLRQWGPPSQEIQLSNGGRILSYSRGTGQVFVPLGNMVVGVPRSCRQDFEINSSGRIVSWRYEGQC